MTKTLTEQWREETLEYGYYYVKHTVGWKPFGITIDFWHGPFDKWGAIPEDYVLEVLAPVPSYDEWKETKAKLKKATELNCNHAYKTNKRRIQINNLKNENNQLREQLKEKNIKLNELRHQRNEANEIIKLITTENRDCYSEATAYLNKWGVK